MRDNVFSSIRLIDISKPAMECAPEINIRQKLIARHLALDCRFFVAAAAVVGGSVSIKTFSFSFIVNIIIIIVKWIAVNLREDHFSYDCFY